MEKSLITTEVIRLICLSLACCLLMPIVPAALAVECPTGDLNGDCKVNFLDFAIMVDNWLEIEPNLPFGSVIINEAMLHSDNGYDWIELYNTTGATVDISGWYLSDSISPLTKYKIANGTTIGPHGYKVFYEYPDFNTPHGDNTPFKLSENGQSIYLSFGKPYPNTTWYTICDDKKFLASVRNVSLGLYTTSIGEVKRVSMEPNTPGQANHPKVGPVVITEIMYDPCYAPDPNHSYNAEYIELKNITNAPVTLQVYDPSKGINVQWKLTEGPNYTFGPNTTIPAKEYIFLVRNKLVFQGLYPSINANKVFQWDSGGLSNDGENIQLSIPGDLEDPNDLASRKYVRIDNVDYSDGSQHEKFVGLDPWPTAADHEGKSLSRIDPNLFGDDVANWHATNANPGQLQ